MNIKSESGINTLRRREAAEKILAQLMSQWFSDWNSDSNVGGLGDYITGNTELTTEQREELKEKVLVTIENKFLY